MKLTPLPESHQSFLFNVTEVEAELDWVDCSIGLDEYLIWLLIELGYPVFTPPWMAEPILPAEVKRVRDYHLYELQVTLMQALTSRRYSGEELIVCTLGRAYCSISFLKECPA